MVRSEAPVDVSIVVATHNRRARLLRLIDALDAQCEPPRFELVVVDDASSDGTAAAVECRAKRSAFPIAVVVQPTNRGPAAARNRGWQAARGPIVCFTDDDCVPGPGWLASLVAATANADIAQGRTVPDPDQIANRGPFSRSMDVPFEQGFYETCNIAYRRDVIERAGGFDEAFRFPYGEDTDLAWRAKEHGARTVFVADAVVRHDVWPSDYRAHLRDMRRREGVVLVFRKHPALRGHFGKGIFFRPIHPPALVATGALAVLASRPRSPARAASATAALLWYAWVCRRFRPNPPRRRQWLGVVPLALGADLYEIAVMARASVRYRTVLL